MFRSGVPRADWASAGDGPVSVFERGPWRTMLADAAIGDTVAARQRVVAELRERLSSGRLPQGEVVPALGEGIVGFARGDYTAAADLIGPMLPEVPRVGGSH